MQFRENRPYVNLLVNYQVTDSKPLQIPSKRLNDESSGEAEEVNMSLVEISVCCFARFIEPF